MLLNLISSLLHGDVNLFTLKLISTFHFTLVSSQVSVISMLCDPNPESPANVDAAVSIFIEWRDVCGYHSAIGC